MVTVDRIGISAEDGNRFSFEFPILTTEILQNVVGFRERDICRLSGQRAPLESQTGLTGIAAPLVAAFDDRRVERRRSKQRMRRLLLQPSIERLEACEHAAHSKNRVAAVERPAAVRSTAAGLDADPLKSFVRDRDIQTSRLRDQSAPGSSEPEPVSEVGNQIRPA
jgi:hypothetical protein